ncbi:hypothetical protein FJU30_17515 [Affinibrenneria salicis]|uniref:Uncharacterized protein n=1 Tax=Affinibrenneria salicis TaxID=2590031 RepID=A0A5J5FX60_9GAMM|nr:hypothetical protein [Affinibrenneria salicis]KAA8998210.1 hypothetical protein FJU30_17515 [Affinibrenneria salicis]
MLNTRAHDESGKRPPRYLILALSSLLVSATGAAILPFSPLGESDLSGIGPFLLFLLCMAIVAFSLLASLIFVLISLARRERLRWLAGLMAAGYGIVVLAGVGWLLGWF